MILIILLKMSIPVLYYIVSLKLALTIILSIYIYI